jgi:acetyltransferase-like isoleucine patch superfamily enzyme
MKRIIRYILTFIYGIYVKRNGVLLHPSCLINRTTYFEGMNKINRRCNILNTKIGKGTYIGNNCELINVFIGRYCSVAQNCIVISATHPTSIFVSTHPAFFSVNKQAGFSFVTEQRFNELNYFDKKHDVSVKIGNDVWIGQDVKIISGVEIGDGAVIASGAVVTKNILPYSIVGGVPAKHIKFRFSENEIEYLLKFKWWDKDLEWLALNFSDFGDIKIFQERHKYR